MGVTYTALDVPTKNPVALKILHLSEIEDWKTLDMFEREAMILQQLNHPQIPAYIDYFSLETASNLRFVLVQQYIAGKTLQQLVEQDWQPDEKAALGIFRQIVNILNYLHTLRPPVIHRDLNPKNIILTPDRKVYLVDFGAVQEKIRTTFFGGSTVVGTCGYAPFEQFIGNALPGSDYYALGACLLYLLTRKHPAEFPMQNLKPVFHENLQASPEILRLLDGLLEPDVRKRIASPEQVQAILDTPGSDRAKAFAVLRQPSISPPAGTKVEKRTEGADRLYFLLPKREGYEHLDIGQRPISSFMPKKLSELVKKKQNSKNGEQGKQYSILELTPRWINFNNEWSVLSHALSPTDITRYLENGKSVFGINYQYETFLIEADLTVEEIHWLTQEIYAYLASLPEEVAPSSETPGDDLSEQATPENIPSRTTFNMLCDEPEHILLHVKTPNETLGCVLLIFAIGLGILTTIAVAAHWDVTTPWLLVPLALGSIFVLLRLIGAAFKLLERIVDMTRLIEVDISPEWLRIRRKIFGIPRTKLTPVATSAPDISDVNWFIRKRSGNKGTIHVPVLGVNADGIALEFACSELSHADAGRLVQEIRQALLKMQHPQR